MYKCRTVSLVIDCMWHIYLSNQIDEIEWTTIVLMVALGAWSIYMTGRPCLFISFAQTILSDVK